MELELKLILAGVAVVLLLIIFAAVIVPKRNEKIVKKTSTLLKELESLNADCSFCDLKGKYAFSKDFPTLQKFSVYEVTKLFDESITQNPELVEQSKAALRNQELYNEYMNKVRSLSSHITPEAAKEFKISYKKYLKIEQKLFQLNQLKPKLDGKIECTVEYTSPGGRNHHSKSDVFDLSYVTKRYDELTEEQSMSNHEKERRKRERALLTPKLRYEILERDGFKCQICGRTEKDGVKLHVDHIFPISKGGATIPENLRTLCSDCNLGKSDKV